MAAGHDEIRLSEDGTFEAAGGFDFIDSVALGLDRRWRESRGSFHPVPVSVLDLAWLIEGYVRARQAMLSDSSDDG